MVIISHSMTHAINTPGTSLFNIVKNILKSNNNRIQARLCIGEKM